MYGRTVTLGLLIIVFFTSSLCAQSNSLRSFGRVPDTTVTISGPGKSEDTFLDKADPSTANGGMDWSWVSADDGSTAPDNDRHILLWFDLSGIPRTTIDSANLSIYVYEKLPLDSQPVVNVYKMLQQWDENTATWTTYDGINFWNIGGGDFNPSNVEASNTFIEESGYITFDITDLVQDWISGEENFGLLIRIDEDDVSYRHARIRSSESSEGIYPNQQPNLTIVYSDPSTPRNFNATTSHEQVTLSWSSNIEPDLHKYNIYRDTSSPAQTLIDSVIGAPPDTFYIDTDVTNSNTYYYRITAVDSSENESGFSDEVSVAYFDPSIPQNLRATPLNEKVILNWSSNTEPDIHKYNIYRDTSSPAQTLVDSVIGSPPDTTYSDTGLANGTIYYYRITAVDNAGNESGFSDEVSAMPVLFTDIGANLMGVQNGSVSWGDYDNDGDLDILLTGEYYSGEWFSISKVYRNDGGGSFTDINAGLTEVAGSSVSWGDYDNDGDLDILLTGYELSKVYRNNGGENFIDINAELIGIGNSSVSWVDYDNDGDLDILLTGWFYDGSINSISKIYRNDGGGSFSDINAELVGVRIGSVSCGDYDNDGDMDILLTGFNSENNEVSKIYRNDGGGSFTDIDAGLIGVASSSVSWGDYDSDGDLDVLLAGDPLSKVYRNDSNDVFTDIGANLVSVGYWTNRSSANWGDYDNDGDLDILLTGSGFSKIYQNHGNDVFADIEANLIDVHYSSVGWGDYDSDGDLDILLTGKQNYSSNYVSIVYKNNIETSNIIPIAPTNLNSFVAGESVTLSWDKSTDNETPQDGLTYNLRVGTTIHGGEIVSPMADISTGYRRIPQMGNANHNNNWTIRNLPNGKYYWSVQAIDNSFAGSYFSVVDSFTIATPPATPVNLVAMPGFERISLNWDENTQEDFSYYVVYRGQTEGFTPLPSDSITHTTTPSFTDTPLPEGELYYYRVSAVDTTGYQSSYSEVASAFTYLMTPTNLIAEAISMTQIDLNWLDNSSVESGYVIERQKIPNELWVIADTLPANSIAYSDSLLEPATTYSYRVMAYRDNGAVSVYSNEVMETTYIAEHTPYGQITAITDIEGILIDTVTILFNSYDPDGSYMNTSDWQFSQDGTNWLDLTADQILGNNLNPPGENSIQWLTSIAFPI